MQSKYKLNPSASERFLTCTASLQHNTGFSESTTTLKGNLQHEVAALRLLQIFKGEDHAEEIERLTDYDNDYISPNNKNIKVRWTHDCEPVVDNYVSYVQRLVQEFKPKEVFIEYKIKMFFYGNAISGTADFVMILPNNDIFIVDLKTGRVKVETKDNKQMLIYGYGVLQDMNRKYNIVATHVIISICQSLINNTQAKKYSINQLATWYLDQFGPMRQINSDKLVYNPSPTACRYCQYRSKCNARIKAGVV